MPAVRSAETARSVYARPASSASRTRKASRTSKPASCSTKRSTGKPQPGIAATRTAPQREEAVGSIAARASLSPSATITASRRSGGGRGQ